MQISHMFRNTRPKSIPPKVSSTKRPDVEGSSDNASSMTSAPNSISDRRSSESSEDGMRQSSVAMVETADISVGCRKKIRL